MTVRQLKSTAPPAASIRNKHGPEEHRATIWVQGLRSDGSGGVKAKLETVTDQTSVGKQRNVNVTKDRNQMRPDGRRSKLKIY